MIAIGRPCFSDYALADWTQAELKRPSTVRLKLATLAGALARYQPGSVTTDDLAQVDGHVNEPFSPTGRSLLDESHHGHAQRKKSGNPKKPLLDNITRMLS